MVGFYARLGEELSLYVRQTAWLHTAPISKDGKRAEQSRMEAMMARDEAPVIPPNPASYLTTWLFEIGPTAIGGMGEGPLGYQDFTAWQAVSGIELMPWEARLLRRLSSEYMAERQRAEEPTALAPYNEQGEIAARRDRVEAQFKAMAQALSRKKEGG